MKKIKVFVLTLLVLIAIGLLLMLAISEYVQESTEKKILLPDQAETMEDIDCIVVLGCLVRPDGSPSGMLEDRLNTAIDLWDRGITDAIVMSGDHGTKEYDEVNAMRDFAVAQGVPIERVFMDHAGFSTYDSLYRLKEVFGAENVIIVTQRYHLYRALHIANALGLKAHGVAADIYTYRGQALRDVREVIARNKDFVKCIFKPEPKYLGNSIDLSDDARVTNG